MKLLALLQDQVPFAVVGSTDEIVVGGHKVRARQYPWGTVEGEFHCHLHSGPFGTVYNTLESVRSSVCVNTVCQSVYV